MCLIARAFFARASIFKRMTEANPSVLHATRDDKKPEFVYFSQIFKDKYMFFISFQCPRSLLTSSVTKMCIVLFVLLCHTYNHSNGAAQNRYPLVFI